MTAEEFQALVEKECVQRNVEYECSSAGHVDWEGNKCSGFFFDEHSGGPILAYATGKPFETEKRPVYLHTPFLQECALGYSQGPGFRAA